MKSVNAIDLVMAEQWAIMPESLKQICTIATRAHEAPESLLKKDGEALNNTRTVEVRDGVSIVPIVGPLFRRANLFTQLSGATSYEVLAKEFTSAVEDPSIKAVILNVDTPGGMVNGNSEFADMVFDARSKKPIIAYVSDLGASAGYWITSAASEIVINKTARVGSIGVVVSASANQKTGVIEIVSSNAPNKRIDPATEEGRGQILTVIDDLETVFIDHVAKFRGVSRDVVLSDFGQGGVLVGEKAISAGMADRIGTLESVIAGFSGNQKEVFIMGEPVKDKPEVTADYIAADHPEIADKFRNEGKDSVDVDAIKTDAAKAECKRIQAVSNQLLAGHEDLIQTLMFDGKTTGEQAAVQVLNAEKSNQGQRAKDLKDLDNAPGAIKDPDSAKPKAGDDWDSDEELRAEFGNDEESYLAYLDAEKNGQFKTIGGKQ